MPFERQFCASRGKVGIEERPLCAAQRLIRCDFREGSRLGLSVCLDEQRSQAIGFLASPCCEARLIVLIACAAHAAPPFAARLSEATRFRSRKISSSIGASRTVA